jgi:hypothetical protein
MTMIGLPLSFMKPGGMVPAQTYIEKVLTYSPIAYWPFNEEAGAAAVCQVNAAQNGTYTGVALNNAMGPDGVNGAPYFDGANDYVGVYSASLRDAFSTAAGSIMIWFKVKDASIWTDGDNRQLLFLGEEASTDRHHYLKRTTNNLLLIRYETNTTNNDLAPTSSSTVWVCMITTWESPAAGDFFRVYFDASLKGEDTVLVNTTVTLNSDYCWIGSYHGPPAQPWDGWLAHVAIFDFALDADARTALAAP